MHLKIRHEIRCSFAAPARNLVSILRLSPRSHEGQHVSDWWIDSDIDCSLKAGNDEFGNVTQTFCARGPLQAITITASGTVDTFDTAGVTRGTVERMPLEIFLRETPSTTADTALRGFANEIGATEPDILGKLHALMDGVNRRTPPETTAFGSAPEEPISDGTYAAESQAHMFIAAARHLGIPCRYVGGYRIQDGKPACHGWTEAYVTGLGWTGFDPASNLCPQGGHIRVAAAFDAFGAAFMRGVDPRHSVHVLSVAIGR